MTNQTSILDDDLTDVYEALSKVFKPTDGVNASFCMDIFGMSRVQSSIVVREWRRLNAA